MSTPTPTLHRIAELGTLQFQPDDLDRFAKDFQDIISLVDQLQDIDVSETLPTNQVTDLENVHGPDTVEPSRHSRTLLETAAHRQDDLIKVPGVFEDRSG